MTTLQRRRITWLTLLVCGVAVIAARAQDKPAPPVDPKADAILRKMGKALGDAKQFTFESDDMTDQMMPSGQKVQVSKHVSVAVRRPNAVAAMVAGDMVNIRYYYDGAQLAIFNERENCYALQEVPATIDEMFDLIAMKFGMTAPLSDLMFADPYKALTERLRSGEYLGLHDVMGTKCHHLAFRQDAIDWQIWIEDGEQPVPRKVVITYKELPGYPQFMALLSNWNLSAQIPDSTFKFEPPPSAKRIDLKPLLNDVKGAATPGGEPGGKQ